MELSLCFFAFMRLASSFLLCHFTIAQFTSSMHPLCHDNERSALLQFKQSVIINHSVSCDPSAYPKVTSWKAYKKNGNCCLWDGIKCDEDTGHVIKLDLASSFLYGSIHSSSSLFHLVHLQWLSLADNHFNSSSIPSGMINLTRLSYLNLSYSYFSGQIPLEILELSKLVFLDVSRNYLELQNPSLTNLSEKLINLNVLNLRKVDISSFVPPALTNLSSLTFLSLGYCGLQGKIPPLLGNLTNLLHLDIACNSFQGELPTSIRNLRMLSYLDVSNCSLTGKFPPSIGNLPMLHHLDLSSNGFLGEFPPSFGNLTHLRTLLISDNNFSGLNSYSLSWIANLQKLTTLDISYSKLTGKIPSGLMNLTQLSELYLTHNQLTGTIPSWLMNLNKLQALFLHSNQLTGHIPFEISNLTQLQHLRLRLNRLEGSIPRSIFLLKNLQGLDFSSNNLSGIVDLNMFLLKLKNLEILILSSNKLSLLTGTTVTALQNFIVLGFGSCNLSEFPYFLHNQDQLMSLDLSSNNIAGLVPGWFLNLSGDNLEYLNLSSNLLTGCEQNFAWTSLVTLDLRFNKMQGSLPAPPISIDSYLFSNNKLIGKIPPWICSLYQLYVLDLSYNNLSGVLPECLGNISYELSVLKLQGNNFHGSIPQTFINKINLRMIDLSSNSLQGRIPQSMGNCVKLSFLNLGNNQITDIFPSWLGSLPELEVLILKCNKFYGVIKEPKAGFEFSKLRIIDISQNRFTGSLPSKYFWSWNAMKNTNASKLTYLQYTHVPHFYPEATIYGPFDYSLTMSNKGINVEYQKLSNLITAIILSDNEFVGEIPTSIANLKGLRTLNLSKNNLEGHIPSSLVNLVVIESLDLSNNKLSGEIPQQLGELTTLEVFNVSHNHLKGPIPRGTQFTTFNHSSFDENPGLCGEPLSKKCENPEASLEEDSHAESLFTFGWKTVLIGYAGGTIIGLVLGHIFSTRKQEWLEKTFRIQLKTKERKRRHRK